MTQTIYDYKARDLSGREINMADYKGKVLLIVNIASKCGFTPQLGGLEELYEKYKSQGLEVIGFPSNSFWQEPLEKNGVSDFCEINYGVKFKIMEKTKVRGSEQHPVFKFLSDKSLNGKVDRAPWWNFYKYLLDRDGKVVAVFSSGAKPMGTEMTSQIEQCLGAKSVNK
jgi:glutathione peroxidase